MHETNAAWATKKVNGESHRLERTEQKHALQRSKNSCGANAQCMRQTQHGQPKKDMAQSDRSATEKRNSCGANAQCMRHTAWATKNKGQSMTQSE